SSNRQQAPLHPNRNRYLSTVICYLLSVIYSKQIPKIRNQPHRPLIRTPDGHNQKVLRPDKGEGDAPAVAVMPGIGWLAVEPDTPRLGKADEPERVAGDDPEVEEVKSKLCIAEDRFIPGEAI